MDNELDRKIDVTAIQTHDWTMIGSGANGLGKKEWYALTPKSRSKELSLCLKIKFTDPISVYL